MSRQALQDKYQKLLVMDLEYALDKKVEQELYVVLCLYIMFVAWSFWVAQYTSKLSMSKLCFYLSVFML